MKRKRKIDQLVDSAATALGSLTRLFEEAGKSAFGKLCDAKQVKQALSRYLERGSLVSWVRRFVFNRIYQKIPT